MQHHDTHNNPKTQNHSNPLNLKPRQPKNMSTIPHSLLRTFDRQGEEFNQKLSKQYPMENCVQTLIHRHHEFQAILSNTSQERQGKKCGDEAVYLRARGLMEAVDEAQGQRPARAVRLGFAILAHHRCFHSSSQNRERRRQASSNLLFTPAWYPGAPSFPGYQSSGLISESGNTLSSFLTLILCLLSIVFRALFHLSSYFWPMNGVIYCLHSKLPL